MIDEKQTFEKFGYVSTDLLPQSNKMIVATCDGCGMNRDLQKCGYSDLCHSCSTIKRYSRSGEREKTSLAMKREKDPLPMGQEITIPKNKSSAVYLGSLAEELLAKTYKDVKRMPSNNHGFDIICNQEFKIDIKSSATGYKGRWIFTINKNQIADYFLCIAFEDRNDLNPVHLWLIPGNLVNHLTGIAIRKSTISKWSKYEQSLDRVLACCNVMKGD